MFKIDKNVIICHLIVNQKLKLTAIESVFLEKVIKVSYDLVEHPHAL